MYARAVDRLEAGECIAGTDLAALIDQNPDVRLPSKLRAHIAKHLRGEIKKSRGRKPVSPAVSLLRDLRDMVEYEHALEAETASKTKLTRAVPGHSGATESVHERAAANVVDDLYGGSIDPRSLLNRLSRRRRQLKAQKPIPRVHRK